MAVWCQDFCYHPNVDYSPETACPEDFSSKYTTAVYQQEMQFFQIKK